MKTYKIKFEGRLLGAIGAFYNYTEDVEANTFEEAKLKLYDKYDHIQTKEVNGIKYDPYNEPK